MRENTAYDYIIVGAGSAGCVLANRLTEDPCARVLLLEAGGSDSQRLISIPIAFSRLFQSACDWSYFTDSEPHLEQRKLYWPGGKVLGGSSSINAMIYIRGHQQDYDRWQELGNQGWSFSSVLPYFRKSENQERGPSEYHGVGGPLNVADLRCINELSERFVQAAEETGFARNPDFNGSRQEGFGFYQVTQLDGQRHSAAAAFLKPVLARRNLTIRTGVQAFSILFERKRAVGVSFQSESGVVQARAEREVILSAGAINSPQLLMLSGIGPADHLRKFTIPVICDLPGVGSNLHDHPALPVAYQSKRPVSLLNAEKISNLARYLCFKNGPLTSNVAEAGGFVKTSQASDAPDLQFHFGPVFYLNHGLERVRSHGFTLGPTLLRPKSRGQIRLRSSNPVDSPSIQANYLAEPQESEVLLEGIKMARALAASRAFDPYRGQENFPGEDVKSDQQIRAYIRRATHTLYHPVGTCRMGSDAHAVVDDQLRVHGVEGLRVVDASIMPEITAGNTNAPTIMIAEKAADLVRNVFSSHPEQSGRGRDEDCSSPPARIRTGAR